MACFLKMIGASDLPLPNDPFVARPELRTQVRFPRDQFPAEMKAGDELLYYAVGGYKKVFAVARLEAAPQRDVPVGDSNIFKRWPHAAPITLGPHLEYVEFAPDLTLVDRGLQERIHQGVSHFPISSAQYSRALSLIQAARQASASRRPSSR